MPGNSFGQTFRITTAGESHGPANVVIIDGCPAGLALTEDDFLIDMARRRPGQSHIVSQRQEDDRVEVLSGTYQGKTTGTSIALLVRNEDARPKDYAGLQDVYRPGHADATFDAKYRLRDPRGGGRASARETVARVAAGVVAKNMIAHLNHIEIVGCVAQIGNILAALPSPDILRVDDVERLTDGSANIVRCPDHAAAAKMIELIDQVRKDRDSIGGVAHFVARNVPSGLGEPVFDKLKADLAKALFSLPAVMGVEMGSGFASATMRGSEQNDLFVPSASGLHTSTNHHGGTLGGITTGMPLVMRVAVKPTSSIPRVQTTVDSHGDTADLRVTGRHDPCLLPRFVPIGEAMIAIVLADHLLRQRNAKLVDEVR